MAGFKLGGIEFKKKVSSITPTAIDRVIMSVTNDDDVVIKTTSDEYILATRAFVSSISADLQNQIDFISGDYTSLSVTSAISGYLSSEIDTKADTTYVDDQFTDVNGRIDSNVEDLALYNASIAPQISVSGSPPEFIVYDDFKGITDHTKTLVYVNSQPTEITELFSYLGNDWEYVKNLTYVNGVYKSKTISITIS